MSDNTQDILTKFNTILLQFLSELDRLFPDSKASNYHTAIKMSLIVDKSAWIKHFIDGTKDHDMQIMTKDEKYFLEQELEFADRLELKKYYQASNDATKDSMWQYMQTLFLLSCSYNNYKPEFLKTVYNVAKETTGVNTTENIMSTIKKMKR